jgi:SAM-dependent methyltransferase
MVSPSVLRSAIERALVSIILAAVVAAGGAGAASPARAQTPKLDVPYVPTPQEVVDKMLEMAAVRGDDFLVDLGSGDGRIPITAAKRFGTRGFGVDLNPERVREAVANAKSEGVTDKVQFVEGDLFKTDFSQASVLTLYLLPSVNLRLRPVILDVLKPGTRVVSHAFHMGDWHADRIEMVDHREIYFWIVPAKVEGKWQVSAGGQSFPVAFTQTFQYLAGFAMIDGKPQPIGRGQVQGARVSFEVTLGGQTKRFEGRVTGNRIEGEGWTASKG